MKDFCAKHQQYYSEYCVYCGPAFTYTTTSSTPASDPAEDSGEKCEHPAYIIGMKGEKQCMNCGGNVGQTTSEKPQPERLERIKAWLTELDFGNYGIAKETRELIDSLQSQNSKLIEALEKIHDHKLEENMITKITDIARQALDSVKEDV